MRGNERASKKRGSEREGASNKERGSTGAGEHRSEGAKEGGGKGARTRSRAAPAALAPRTKERGSGGAMEQKSKRAKEQGSKGAKEQGSEEALSQTHTLGYLLPLLLLPLGCALPCSFVALAKNSGPYFHASPNTWFERCTQEPEIY